MNPIGVLADFNLFISIDSINEKKRFIVSINRILPFSFFFFFFLKRSSYDWKETNRKSELREDRLVAPSLSWRSVALLYVYLVSKRASRSRRPISPSPNFPDASPSYPPPSNLLIQHALLYALPFSSPLLDLGQITFLNSPTPYRVNDTRLW